MKRVLPPLLALFVGTITLAFTIGLCVHERDSEQARLRAVFDANARQTAGRIEQRIANYEQMLRGVQGLFSAGGDIDQAAFRTYVDTVLAGPDAAGLQSVAYSAVTAPDALPGRLERLRREQADPAIRLHPEGPRDLYAPIAMIAPDTPANRTVLGFDSLSDPTRHAAMLQARDSGNAMLTALVQLRVDTGGELKAGCLLYLPVYARGKPTGSVAERRASGIGWVRAAFRVGDLMSTLYGEQSPGLVVRLHDGTDAGEASLMYRSDLPGDPGAETDADHAPRFQAQEYVTLAGHTWTVQLSSLPEFERVHGRNASSVILVAGIVLSLLLGVITHQLVTGRTRAYAAAQAMTRELRASEERYRRIVETAGEGIWLLDAARRIAFVNPRIAQWMGMSEAQMQGRPVDDFMDPEDAARCRAALAAQEGKDTSSPIELRLRRGDGTSMWVSLSTRPIFDDAGNPAGALGMLTDINERRLAEERRAALETQLRDAQKMEAIGTLAGGIAHDFNNILAAIIGNVSAARQDAAIGLSNDASLAQIERSAVRARSLVQQILTFSRMQAQELQTQALQPVVEETLDMLRAAMPAQVELRVSLPCEPVWVRADATQMQQVVMNLCTNAWHALPAGRGCIEVGLAAEPALAGRAAGPGGAMPPPALRGPRAHLWVVDNGSGMDEATRARVFEPFFTTKQVGQGTGLGLAVVHGIVSVHGGAIHVGSTPGQGSRFDLWFPLQDVPPAPVEVPAPATSLPRGHGERVLCVDDDPAMALMVEGLLKRAGYRVTMFEQPEAALARVQADPGAFDVVVTDFNMPEMNGMELAAAIAVAAPKLPIIITSGFISDEMRQQATDQGVAALLQKEYTLERLGALVNGVLEQHRSA